jgi:hypothetical protein
MNGGANDFLLVRGGPAFRSGSGCSMEDEAAMFSALHAFLGTNCLLQPGFERPEHWSDYELRAMHLTDEGMAVMRCGLDKWLRAIDRGTAPGRTTALEKCLRSIRQ